MSFYPKHQLSIAFVLGISLSSPMTHARVIDPLYGPIPVDEKLIKGQLENGLNYYILPNKTPEKKVELRLIVKAGSLNERDDEQGLAHFMEHMAFNGTAHFPKHELTNQLEQMGVQFGADLNAYTGFNETVYILPIPTANPKNLSTGMQILEDWAFNASLDRTEIEQERGVVLEEWRASTQNPESRIMEQSIGVMAKGSTYAKRLPIGKTEVIEHAPPERLRDFYHRWYRPNLMAVVMVGDVTATQGKALIEQHFAKHTNPNASEPLAKSSVPNNQEPVVAIFKDKDLTANTITWLQKEQNDTVLSRDVRGYVNDQKRTLLTQMMNHRLSALLDSPTPPFVGAVVQIGDLGGIVRNKQALHLIATAAPGQQKSTLEALQREVLRVLQHGFTQPELDRSVKEMLADMQTQFINRDKAESASKAAEYVRGETEGEPLPSLAWEERTLRSELPKINLNDINALARYYFTPENRMILVAGNDSTAALSEKSITTLLGQTPEVEPYGEKPDATRLLTTPPKAGKTIATTFDKALNLTTWTLSNGVKVSYKPTDFNQDRIEFASTMAGGFSRLSDEDWQRTHWAFDALPEAGVNGLSKTQLSRLLSDKVGQVELDADDTQQGVHGFFAPKDAETFLTLTHSLLTGLNNNPDSFKGVLERNMAATANLERDRMATFQDTFERNLNRNNPRFHGAYPNANAWKNSDYALAYRNFRQAFANVNGLHFTFVGKIEPKELQRLSELYLGSLPSDASQSPHFKDHGYRPDFTNRTIEVKKGKEPLSLVHIEFGGETVYDPKERMAMDAIGYVMTMRLLNQLREAQGGVYSIEVSGQIIKQPYGRYAFAIDFPCEPAKADALTQSALQELKQFITAGPTSQEMDKFRQARTVSRREEVKTNAFWLSQLQGALKNGSDPKDILSYENRLNALSAADVQKVARNYLTDHMVIAVLKPE
ncbi:putative zinc protease [Ephemeroptericola cinctiostellae]|uniref:Putative zinc protease n=1 Tax=Ephemeroptericola cinctiostellae TaxID=2268024 RepID=A0A345D8N5_9BURK|nr:M16 family metallopeptidase [Ephemeroptericola cinctiostellae]AXF84723.1 putative zinc protease [Ephemeroptericola cinctiostellae]